MDLDRALSGMFSLILVFLLLSRADEFSEIIRSAGGFVTQQTQALQGVGFGGLNTVIR